MTRISTTLLFPLICDLANYLRVEAVNCQVLTDCYTCSSSMDGLLPCHWCSTSQSCMNSFDSLKCSEFMRVTYGYDCPFQPHDQFPYLDLFARSRALPFISAANSKSPEMLSACLRSNIPNIRVISVKQVPCDPICNYCLAYLAYSPDDNALVLTFRSTNSASQLLLEALNTLFYLQKDFVPVGGMFPASKRDANFSLTSSGKVGSYFHDAFYALWNSGLLNDFRTALQEYPTAEVWVFGHSLGGSLASLGAAWISKMRMVAPEKIKFISFGQPRTGNMVYAMIFDALIPYKYRIVHRGDIITKAPVRLPFLNAGSFTHHRFEVFYPNDMHMTDGYMVCSRAEDPLCSQTCLDPLGPEIHRHYFNTSLSDWPKEGCPRSIEILQLSSPGLTPRTIPITSGPSSRPTSALPNPNRRRS